MRRIITVLVCSFVATAMAACNRGDRIRERGEQPVNPLAPSLTPPLNEAFSIMLVDVKRGTPDPKFPALASCPNAMSIWVSGQVRNAANPALATTDSLSGGTLIVWSCNWKTISGFHDATPLYGPGTDSGVLAAAPTRDSADFTLRGETFQKMKFKLTLAEDKAKISPTSLRADEDRAKDEWWVRGPFSALPALTVGLTALQVENFAATARSLISPAAWPVMTEYGIPLDPDQLLYVSPEGQIYLRDFGDDTIARVR